MVSGTLGKLADVDRAGQTVWHSPIHLLNDQKLVRSGKTVPKIEVTSLCDRHSCNATPQTAHHIHIQHGNTRDEVFKPVGWVDDHFGGVSSTPAPTLPNILDNATDRAVGDVPTPSRPHQWYLWVPCMQSRPLAACLTVTWKVRAVRMV